MAIQPIQPVQQNTKSKVLNTTSAAVGGACVGAVARYAIPTKEEFSNLKNKEAFDKFISSSATSARGSKRSILKYSGIGALIGAGLMFLSKIFPKNTNNENQEYTKLGTLIDVPDYACEIFWYNDGEE